MGPPFVVGRFDFRGLGPLFAVAFLLPIIGGIALDSWLHTAPGFLLLGGFVGLVAVFVVFWFHRKDFRD